MSGFQDKPVFFGFLGVGFLSLLGGIAMFAYVVPREMKTAGPPRDVGLLFTNVFTQQIVAFNENKRYAAALSQVGVSHETCARYGCRLTVPPDGATYVFRLSSGGRTWTITPKTPVPQEEKPEQSQGAS